MGHNMYCKTPSEDTKAILLQGLLQLSPKKAFTHPRHAPYQITSTSTTNPLFGEA